MSKQGKSQASTPTCCLCHLPGGGGSELILSSEDAELRGDKTQQRIYYHAACAEFTRAGQKWPKKPAGRRQAVWTAVTQGAARPCCLCGNTGATIKCAHRTCPRWFHWPCVRLQGLAGSVEFNVPEQLLACAEHSRCLLFTMGRKRIRRGLELSWQGLWLEGYGGCPQQEAAAPGRKRKLAADAAAAAAGAAQSSAAAAAAAQEVEPPAAVAAAAAAREAWSRDILTQFQAPLAPLPEGQEPPPRRACRTGRDLLCMLAECAAAASFNPCFTDPVTARGLLKLQELRGQWAAGKRAEDVDIQRGRTVPYGPVFDHARAAASAPGGGRSSVTPGPGARSTAGLTGYTAPQPRQKEQSDLESDPAGTADQRQDQQLSGSTHQQQQGQQQQQQAEQPYEQPRQQQQSGEQQDIQRAQQCDTQQQAGAPPGQQSGSVAQQNAQQRVVIDLLGSSSDDSDHEGAPTPPPPPPPVASGPPAREEVDLLDTDSDDEAEVQDQIPGQPEDPPPGPQQQQQQQQEEDDEVKEVSPSKANNSASGQQAAAPLAQQEQEQPVPTSPHSSDKQSSAGAPVTALEAEEDASADVDATDAAAAAAAAAADKLLTVDEAVAGAELEDSHAAAAAASTKGVEGVRAPAFTLAARAAAAEAAAASAAKAAAAPAAAAAPEGIATAAGSPAGASGPPTNGSGLSVKDVSGKPQQPPQQQQQQQPVEEEEVLEAAAAQAEPDAVDVMYNQQQQPQLPEDIDLGPGLQPLDQGGGAEDDAAAAGPGVSIADSPLLQELQAALQRRGFQLPPGLTMREHMRSDSPGVKRHFYLPGVAGRLTSVLAVCREVCGSEQVAQEVAAEVAPRGWWTRKAAAGPPVAAPADAAAGAASTGAAGAGRRPSKPEEGGTSSGAAAAASAAAGPRLTIADSPLLQALRAALQQRGFQLPSGITLLEVLRGEQTTPSRSGPDRSFHLPGQPQPLRSVLAVCREVCSSEQVAQEVAEQALRTGSSRRKSAAGPPVADSAGAAGAGAGSSTPCDTEAQAAPRGVFQVTPGSLQRHQSAPLASREGQQVAGQAAHAAGPVPARAMSDVPPVQLPAAAGGHPASTPEEQQRRRQRAMRIAAAAAAVAAAAGGDLGTPVTSSQDGAPGGSAGSKQQQQQPSEVTAGGSSGSKQQQRPGVAADADAPAGSYGKPTGSGQVPGSKSSAAGAGALSPPAAAMQPPSAGRATTAGGRGYSSAKEASAAGEATPGSYSKVSDVTGASGLSAPAGSGPASGGGTPGRATQSLKRSREEEEPGAVAAAAAAAAADSATPGRSSRPFKGPTSSNSGRGKVRRLVDLLAGEQQGAVSHGGQAGTSRPASSGRRAPNPAQDQLRRAPSIGQGGEAARAGDRALELDDAAAAAAGAAEAAAAAAPPPPGEVAPEAPAAEAAMPPLPRKRGRFSKVTAKRGGKVPRGRGARHSPAGTSGDEGQPPAAGAVKAGPGRPSVSPSPEIGAAADGQPSKSGSGVQKPPAAAAGVSGAGGSRGAASEPLRMVSGSGSQLQQQLSGAAGGARGQPLRQGSKREVFPNPDSIQLAGMVDQLPPLHPLEVRAAGSTIHPELVPVYKQVTHNFLTLRGEKREVYTTVKGRREQLARITALEEWCEKRSSSWWQQVEVLPVDLMNWYKGDKTDKTSSLAGRQALLKSKRLRVGDIEAAVAHRLEQQQPDPTAAVPEDIPVDGIAFGLLPMDHPCEQLRGQGSVVATRDLEAGVVVASYRSYAALENQYRRFRLSPPSSWPNDGHWRAVYEMLVECYAVEDGVHVLVPPWHTSDDGDAAAGAAAGAGGGAGDQVWKVEALSYSAWGYGNATACANDPVIGVVDAILADEEPVQQWYNKGPTVEGGANCLVMPIYIRGWPHLFMITTQPIAKGQHLYFEYGAGYWGMFAEYLMRVGHHSGDMCQERDGLAKLEAALAQCRQYNTARLTGPALLMQPSVAGSWSTSPGTGRAAAAAAGAAAGAAAVAAAVAAAAAAADPLNMGSAMAAPAVAGTAAAAAAAAAAEGAAGGSCPNDAAAGSACRPDGAGRGLAEEGDAGEQPEVTSDGRTEAAVAAAGAGGVTSPTPEAEGARAAAAAARQAAGGEAAQAFGASVDADWNEALQNLLKEGSPAGRGKAQPRAAATVQADLQQQQQQQQQQGSAMDAEPGDEHLKQLLAAAGGEASDSGLRQQQHVASARKQEEAGEDALQQLLADVEADDGAAAAAGVSGAQQQSLPAAQVPPSGVPTGTGAAPGSVLGSGPVGSQGGGGPGGLKRPPGGALDPRRRKRSVTQLVAPSQANPQQQQQQQQPQPQQQQQPGSPGAELLAGLAGSSPARPGVATGQPPAHGLAAVGAAAARQVQLPPPFPPRPQQQQPSGPGCRTHQQLQEGPHGRAAEQQYGSQEWLAMMERQFLLSALYFGRPWVQRYAQ